MPAFVDLTGQRFGRLLVIEREPKQKGKPAKWRCRCGCGNEVSVLVGSLRGGRSKSCGCFNVDINRTLKKRHGHHPRGTTGTPTYSSWTSMKKRCLNPKCQDYPDYGGRGIKVCERWQTFEHFLDDMGEKPPRTSLDRIDPNGNYEPENCRWATNTEQSRNRRDRKLTADMVNEIRGRHEHGEPHTSIARCFGTTPTNVRFIVTRRTWADVP